MTVSILLMTHNNIGDCLLQTTTKVLGMCPLNTRSLSVPFDSDPDHMLQQATEFVQSMDTGDGVLILTDMFGATPSNIAHRLSEPGKVMVVTGLNLPMMMRIMNYPNFNLEEMVEAAVTGGKEGVIYNRRALS